MPALIQLTLDGTLVTAEHQVSLRVLAHTMQHIQTAADRAFLDVKHGNVAKHQRLSSKYYGACEFMVGDPRHGSYVIEFLSKQGKEIVKRIQDAMDPVYNESVTAGEKELYTLQHQIAGKKDAVEQSLILPQTFERFVVSPNTKTLRSYGDKSINKEVSQLLVPVRRNSGALLKLALKDSDENSVKTFTFDKRVATKFQKIISERQLGEPVVYRGKLRELDHGHNKTKNFKGKFINAVNDKDVTLHIQTEEDFQKLSPYINQATFTLVACPIIEFDAFDPVGGDIQFLDLYHG